jgi:peptide/nickel transport system substrate-binding protein
MDRLVVDFQLRSGVTWSDGEPLTAEDSVFSFQLNADGRTPGSKDLVYRTASYEAVDERTVRWTGIPGYIDPEIAAHFWSPLPKHLLGDFPVGDLPTADVSAVTPVGWGPYQIESRVPGSSIALTRNPHYFRAADGLPVFDEVLFRFVGHDPETVVQQVLNGECDFADESALGEDAWPLLLQHQAEGDVQLVNVPGPRMMRADFLESNSPIFRDAATRTALAECTDRNGWSTRHLGGLGSVPASYIPPNHPLADADLAPVPYSAAAASAALESAGWTDDDRIAATPRVAQGVAGVPNGTPLAWTLGASPGGLEESWAEQLIADFAACGARVSLEPTPADQLFAPYPNGPAFGGRLGMVVWSWLGWVTPACDLFASWEIPSAETPEGANASGFSDAAYDTACRAILFSPGLEGVAAAAAKVTQQVFVNQLPALPLVVLPRIAATSPELCGPRADPSPPSLLWDIETLAPCRP